MGCEWLAGLVSRVYPCVDCTDGSGWEGYSVGGLYCVGFVCEIAAASSDNGGGRVLGLMCMEGIGAGSNLAMHFDFFCPCRIFKVLAVRICIVNTRLSCMHLSLQLCHWWWLV